MREFKFRAWDNEDNKMWKVVAISESIWGYCEDKHIRVCDFGKMPEDKSTDVRLSIDYKLMQYTGLKDVNGREIYEGDVVKIIYCESPLLVTYDSGMFLAEFTNGNVHYLGEHYIGCEVLGNFYENPELWTADYFELEGK